MKRSSTSLLILAAVSALTGCGPNYIWINPDNPGADSGRALVSCEASALRDMPPSNVMESQSSSSSGTVKDKNKKTTYEDDSDTSYSYVDANDDKREILINDCMYKSGWVQKTVS